MRGLTKDVLQGVFRDHNWSFHLVIEPGDVMKMGDQEALKRMRLLNYRLCKWWLPRRFANFPLDQRFHWAAFFQGTRDAGTRHLHVLLHVPPAVSTETTLRQLKLKSSIEALWRGLGDRNSGWLWKRLITDRADNRAVATYVSRKLTRASWETEDVHFSQ